MKKKLGVQKKLFDYKKNMYFKLSAVSKYYKNYLFILTLKQTDCHLVFYFTLLVFYFTLLFLRLVSSILLIPNI